MVKRHLLLLITVLVFPISFGLCQSYNEIGREFLESRSIRPSLFHDTFRFSSETHSGNQIILESESPPCFVVLQRVKKDLTVVAYSTNNAFTPIDSVQAVSLKLLEALRNTSPREFYKSGNMGDRIPAGPLLKTHWGQDNWFNRYCPYEIQCDAGEKVYAGCIAVAMGQIIRYYGKWNNFVLDAHHSYKNEQLRAYSTGYKWPEMINSPLSYDLEVSQMLSDLGVLIKMNYGFQNSSQGSGMARIGFNDLGFGNAYKEQSHHFDQEEWIDLILTSLEEYSPVFVCGGGHAFVCDGYDQDGRLHFNLGWGGFGDGYYNVNSVYGKYYANEIILEVIPENEFEPPHSLRLGQIESNQAIVWSPPYQWGRPEAYRVYYSDNDFFEVQDTTLQIENLRPGTHGIMVSALYPDGESIWTGPVWVYNEGENVTITDPALRKAVLNDKDTDLPLESNNIVQEGVMADLRSLSLVDSLETTNQILNMFRLQELELNGSGLTREDMEFISSLHHLQTLKISNCDCEILPDLGMNPKLVHLKLDSCKARDLNFLSGIEDLVILEISSCNIELLEIPSTQNRLEHLYINNTPLPKTGFISGLSNLRILDLSASQLTDINLSNPMPRISCLKLNDNALSNTGFLTLFPSLKSVCARNNQISHLAIHSDLPFLRSLDFGFNNIDQVSIVYDLPEMNYINLEHNQFEDFPGIFKHMPNLETLNLGGNLINRLPGMSLPFLQNLDLSGNRLNHITGIDHFDALRSLNLEGNFFSDFSPLLKNNNYCNLWNLDLRNNPVSQESHTEVLPLLVIEVDHLLIPDTYEKRSPCYPTPESPARLSNTEVPLSWYCENDDPEMRYDITLSVGDSILTIYKDLTNKGKTIKLREGQKYHWQVRAHTGDSSFCSGLYEIRTTEELEIPYFENFELFKPGDNITSASSNWRLSNGGSDVYQDAAVTDIKGAEGGGNSLHIQNYTDVTIDLDHIEVSTLIIEYDQFILPGKSVHTCLKDVYGLQADIFSNGYISELYINKAPYSEFEVQPNQWNRFRISIQGQNKRIIMRCNDYTFLNKFWNFYTDKAHIEGISFSRGNTKITTRFSSFECFLDNLLIYDANNRTSVEEPDAIGSDISIYPNPADQFIRIDGLPDNQINTSIEILNSRGQKIHQGQLGQSPHGFILPVDHLSPGVYFYRLTNDRTSLASGKMLIVR